MLLALAGLALAQDSFVSVGAVGQCERTVDGEKIVTIVQYTNAPTVQAVERERAQLEAREPRSTITEAGGGVFNVGFISKNFSLASPDRYLLIVREAGGADVTRVRPPTTFPATKNGAFLGVFAIAIQPILQLSAFPLQVFVVDSQRPERCDFAAATDGTVTHVSSDPLSEEKPSHLPGEH